MQVARARHVGATLLNVDKEERKLLRMFRAETDALKACKLVDAIDKLRDRRRILLGEPLPGSRRAGTERRPVLPVSIVDVQPMDQLPAPAPASMISDAEASSEPLG